MQLQLWAPLVVAAGLLAAGSLAMMLLPEMALKPLEDTVEDAAERTSHDANLGLPDHAGLREISLQGVAAAVLEGVRRQRTSSRSWGGGVWRWLSSSSSGSSSNSSRVRGVSC
jgi:hypothetical protein